MVKNALTLKSSPCSREQRPLVIDIARGVFTDGPGIRTTVFFKGCPLSCHWCHNPESQNPGPEVFFNASDCIQCGNCQSGKNCFTAARREIGQYYPPHDLVALLLADKTYYKASGGGVTFSGGEPLLFMDFLSDILSRLKAVKVHTVLQTCGYFDFSVFERLILPYIDLIHFDLKLIDTNLHRKYTGQPNARILSNLCRLVKAGARVLPRMPLVPGYTATHENLSALAGLLARLRLPACEFMPYNPLGLDKLRQLGRQFPAGIPLSAPVPENIKAWIDFFLGEYRLAGAK